MLAVALVAVVAAVLIIALGGTDNPRHGRPAGAVAAGGKSATQLASSYLGVEPSTLRRRLRSGETLAEVAESTPGHSARGLMRALLAYRAAELRTKGVSPSEARVQEQKLRVRLRAQLRRKRRIGAVLGAASSYLGLSEAALRAQLRSGRTLAQVAAAHGHTREQLVEAILRVRRRRVVAAHRAHQVTAAQERKTIEVLKRRVERAVNAQP